MHYSFIQETFLEWLLLLLFYHLCKCGLRRCNVLERVKIQSLRNQMSGIKILLLIGQ